MDIPRPENKRRKRLRQAIYGGGTAVLMAALALGVSRLEPAAPSVARASVWVDTVRQGEMLRQVRGSGTLVPREIRWIAAQSGGRVDRVIVRPGAVVEPDTVLAEISNPDLMREAEEARYELEAARAELTELELRLRGEQLAQRAAVASARVAYEGARLQAEAEAAAGVVPALQVRRSELLAEELKVSLEIEQERLDQFAASIEAQIAARKARVAQQQNAYERVLDQIEALDVRAGIAGVVQQVLIEEGQTVDIGANGWFETMGVSLKRGRLPGSGDRPGAPVEPIKRAVWAVDSTLPLVRTTTMTDLVARSEAQRTFALTVFAAFGLAALLLAAVGVYGVVEGRVAERTREIGLRAALGAAPADVARFVLRHGRGLAGVGKQRASSWPLARRAPSSRCCTEWRRSTRSRTSASRRSWSS